MKNCFATFDAFHIQYTNYTDMGDDLNFNGEKKTQIVFSCDLTGYKRVLVKYTVQYDANSAFDLSTFKRLQNRCPHLIISTFQRYFVQR